MVPAVTVVVRISCRGSPVGGKHTLFWLKQKMNDENMKIMNVHECYNMALSFFLSPRLASYVIQRRGGCE